MLAATTRPPLDLTVQPAAVGRQIHVGGELDAASGCELAAVTASVIAAHPGRVDLDLSAVTFADSASWRAVHAACRRVNDTGGTSSVVATSAAIDYLVRKWDLARRRVPA